MSDSDFIECCQLLTKLAILKSVKKEEEEIAFLAKFLLSEISIEDIKTACGFFARRKDKFPDAADFYNLVVPMTTVDELAEKEVAGIIDMIRSGFDKEKLTENQKDLLEKWPWGLLKESSLKDINQTRISMVFYLKNKLGNDGKTKLLLNKQSFGKYKSNLLTSGGNNGQDLLN